MTISIITWNILAHEWLIHDKYISKIKHNVNLNRKDRLDIIIHKLKKYNTDIICLQEVMKYEFSIIKKNFPNYIATSLKPIIWYDTHISSESGNIILLKKNKFTNVKQYNETHYCYVKCIYNKQSLFIYNIHLDDVNKLNRYINIQQILNNTHHKTDKIIIAGDFNENYDSNNKLYKTLIKNKYKITNKHTNTYILNNKLNIDNIIFNGFKLFKYYVNSSIKNPIEQLHLYGTDHFYIVALLL